MKVKAFRYPTAQRIVGWFLLLLGLGCGPGSRTEVGATPSGSETHGGEHDAINQPEAAPDLLAEEMMAYERAWPIFEQYCARCHATTGSRATKKTLSHFNMDDYPFGGHHQAEIAQTVRVVLGATGEKATMPRNDPGLVQGEDLALILDWADSFDRAEAAGLHGAAPDHHGDAD